MFLPPDKQALEMAADILDNGGLVAFATDTIYGLGADAANQEAVSEIYRLKHRSEARILAVLVKDIEMAERYGVFDERARTFADLFWPGAVTLIVPKRKDGQKLAPSVRQGLGTVALRVPKHKTTQALLSRLDRAIAAPSANLAGEVPSATPLLILRQMTDKIPLVLAEGHCTLGVESTLIDLTGDEPKILRQGAVLPDEIEAKSGLKFAPYEEYKSGGGWKPKMPLRLNAVDVRAGEALLAFGKLQFMAAEDVESGFAKDLPSARLYNLSEDGDPDQALQRLYHALHRLEVGNPTAIAVMPMPKSAKVLQWKLQDLTDS